MKTNSKDNEETHNNVLVGLGILVLALVYVFISGNVDVAVIDTEQLANTNLSIDDSSLIVQNNLFGVPNTFTKETSNEEPYNILKGAVNQLRLRPQVLNEHAESSREIKAIVTNNTIVGQIFRASQDNINSIYLTLESAQALNIDNFESYNTSEELQAVWIADGNLAALETGTVYSGTQSMALLGSNLDSWTRNVTAADYTDYTGSFEAYFTKEYDKFKVSVFVGDGTNTKSQDLVFNVKDTWVHFDIDESAMVEDQAAITNSTAITQIGFRITDKELGQYVYLDNIIATPPPGELGVQLWDMGTTLPVSGITSLTDGTRYTQIGDLAEQTPVAQYDMPLDGGKRLYHLHYFACGTAQEIPLNELLNVGNYYALVLNYIDTGINVYGATFVTDYYESGYAFSTPNNSTPINITGVNADLMFSIFSTQDVYLTESRAIADALPGSLANYMSSIENINMTTTDVITTHGLYVPEFGAIDFDIRPLFLGKGGKFNLDYNDDPSDDVSKVIFGMRYVYEPPFVYG